MYTRTYFISLRMELSLLALLLIQLCALLTHANETLPAHPRLRAVCVLPTQAFLCDAAGTGHVVESGIKTFRIIVDNYWIGNPGSNSLVVATDERAPPVSDRTIVFLATTNSYFSPPIVEPLTALCQWSFLTNRFINPAHTEQGDPVEITAVPWRLVGDSLSWFHSDTDGGLVTGYVSNLTTLGLRLTTTRSTSPCAMAPMFRDPNRDGYSPTL